MKAKSHPTGQGRIWTKDIDYTTPGKKLKENGLKPDTCPTTEGMESVTRTPRPKHDISVKGIK